MDELSNDLKERMKESRSRKRNQMMHKFDEVNTFASTYENRKTKAISITLPEGLIEYLELLKDAMGYNSISFTIRMILEDYFKRILDDTNNDLEQLENKEHITIPASKMDVIEKIDKITEIFNSGYFDRVQELFSYIGLALEETKALQEKGKAEATEPERQEKIESHSRFEHTSFDTK